MRDLPKKSSLVAWMALCGLLLPLLCAEGVEQVDPPYLYKSWGARDPFRSLRPVRVKPEIIIHDLTLTGIVSIGGGRVAVFKRKGGPELVYKLRGAQLYGKDGELVPAVRGKIIDDQTVLLVQGDEQIPFKLSAQQDEEEKPGGEEGAGAE